MSLYGSTSLPPRPERRGFSEDSDDATLYALLAVLAQHSAQVAQQLAQQHYMHHPDMPEVAQQQRALAGLTAARALYPSNGEPGLGPA